MNITEENYDEIYTKMILHKKFEVLNIKYIKTNRKCHVHFSCCVTIVFLTFKNPSNINVEK